AGLAAALVYEYDDDEAGSPWRFVLHVDERGDERQRTALADILLGRAGGERVLRLPWVRKPSNLLEVRASRVEVGEGRVAVGAAVAGGAGRRCPTGGRVSCIGPGQEVGGTELVADELVVHDDPFDWELSGNCAFTARFDYSG